MPAPSSSSDEFITPDGSGRAFKHNQGVPSPPHGDRRGVSLARWSNRSPTPIAPRAAPLGQILPSWLSSGVPPPDSRLTTWPRNHVLPTWDRTQSNRDPAPSRCKVLFD